MPSSHRLNIHTARNELSLDYIALHKPHHRRLQAVQVKNRLLFSGVIKMVDLTWQSVAVAPYALG